ncbi:MAG: hypothetical protein HQL93_03355 [Magnetococcales bacterium]|nr:hypothetical protein [Magnetococcales bacterium]
MSTSKKNFKVWPWALMVLLIGGGVGLVKGLPEPRAKAKFIPVETTTTVKSLRLPLAPHIHQLRARPEQSMLNASVGMGMRFRLLDKRTLRVDQLVISVGELHAGPWGGWIIPLAYASDLVIRDGEAVHGHEGHVNPAVWVELKNHDQKLFYEGWLFARDSAQTAWDHPRFDLTFLGPEEAPIKKMDNRSAPPSGKGSIGR